MFYRVFFLLYIILSDICMAWGGYWLLVFWLSPLHQNIAWINNCKIAWIISGIYIIWCIVQIAIGVIHYCKWYIRKYIVTEHCEKCGTEVIAVVPEVNGKLEYDPNAIFHSMQCVIFSQKYRPRLQYICSECGQKEYICPYCYKLISKEDEKCPHCGIRITD